MWGKWLTNNVLRLFPLRGKAWPCVMASGRRRARLSFPKHSPDLNISEESAAEMVAALIFAMSDGKPRRIARRVALMRAVLDARAKEQKVVALRTLLCPNGTKARAGEAAARLERVEIILQDIARL